MRKWYCVRKPHVPTSRNSTSRHTLSKDRLQQTARCPQSARREDPSIRGGGICTDLKVLLYYRIAVPFDSGGGVGGTRVVYRGLRVGPVDVYLGPKGRPRGTQGGT